MRKILGIILICISVSSFGQGLSRRSLTVFRQTDSIKMERTLRSTSYGLTLEDKQYQKLEARKISRDNWFKVNHFSIYGGGALEGLVTGKNTDSINESTSTTGNIGFIIVTNRLSCDIAYSYNGREVIQMNSLGQFGSSLLNPKLSGESFSISALSRLNNSFGIYTSFQVACNEWQTDSASKIAASPIIFRLGVCWNVFDFQDDIFNFTVNANYTHRSILGDFNNADYIIDGYTIHPRGYNGFDVSGNFYLNSIRFIFQYSQNLDGKIERREADDLVIPGFSGGQVTLAVVVSGNVIDLSKK